MWEAFKALPAGKRAPATFMILTTEVKKASSNMQINELADKNVF